MLPAREEERGEEEADRTDPEADERARKVILTAFGVSIEAPEEVAGRAAGELVFQLLCNPEADALAGAELVVSGGWIGLRSHPRVVGTVTYGGPAVPSWLDVALRDMVPAAGASPDMEA